MNTNQKCVSAFERHPVATADTATSPRSSPFLSLQQGPSTHPGTHRHPTLPPAPQQVPHAAGAPRRQPLLLWAPQTQDNWNTCFQVSPRSYQAGVYPISVETCVTALHFMPFGWGRQGGK